MCVVLLGSSKNRGTGLIPFVGSINMHEIMTHERTNKGVRRLLTATKDLKQCGAPAWNSKNRGDGSPAHRSLFAEYEEVLSAVASVALEWWAGTIEARVGLSSNSDEAIRQAWMARPAGPASYPGFVALIRDYWLACDDLNKHVPQSQRVPPEDFLLSWLLDGRHEREVKVLACMPYWPIGLDADGNWV